MISVDLRKQKRSPMNHQPFEDWLLNDQPLTPTEKRDLDAHIQTCRYCAALVETGLELHSVRMVSPMPGFAGRFEKRLAAQRTADLRRRLCGLIALLLDGAGLLFCLTALMQFVEAGKIKLDKAVVAS
jgi:hypothetical protein